ncbi:MAG: hypothetical protein H7647_08725 [Candidatus Heimdallarchaeota archaeon]|nr:hypothetical protein [Candidatus Heimdallarchaeota archaeon]MCK4254510.1 hypothetical protein [Candidatus Heimdallarchaeota archaeon]
MAQEVKKSTDKKKDETVLTKKSTRFGWKDFTLNLVFSLIMIASFVVFVFIQPPAEGDLTAWFSLILITIIPLLIFGNRVIRESIYQYDFITIEGTSIKYRSTPLLFTGIRTKKSDVDIRSIRKFGISKIPRKFSLDMRKYKNKAVLILNLKDGKEHILGEYFTNEDLVEICVYIKNIYPKAKLVTNLGEEYPKLEELKKKVASSKKIKELEDDGEPEGVEIRRK